MFPVFTVVLLQALAKTNAAASLLDPSGFELNSRVPFLANPGPNLRVNQGQWWSDPWAVPPRFLPNVLTLPNTLPTLGRLALPGVLLGYPGNSLLISRYQSKRVYPGSHLSFSNLDNQPFSVYKSHVYSPGLLGDVRYNAVPTVYRSPYGVSHFPRVSFVGVNPSDYMLSHEYNGNWGREDAEAVLDNVLGRDAARRLKFPKISKHIKTAAKVAKGVGSVLQFVNDNIPFPSQEENTPPPSN